MLVTCDQMREAEERAFAAGITAEALMEQAGAGIAQVVQQFFPGPGTLILYLGNGNNAGDALVAARHLQKLGWRLQARLSAAPERMKDLPRRHLEALADLRIDTEARPPDSGSLVLLDGLLGIGSHGPLREPLRLLAAEMNHLRKSHHAHTVAMDIPSGLDGDTGLAAEGAVIADVTAAVGCIKTGLVADPAAAYVGRLALVPLHAVAPEGDASAAPLTPALLRSWVPRRSYAMHKGEAGRVGVLAGSCGFLGAARLACEGGLRAGAGLVTLLVKDAAYPLLATTVAPEIMVRRVTDYRETLDLRFDALAVGPGLGFEAETEIWSVLKDAPIPTIIDADALTLCARRDFADLQQMAGPRLFTPHPGEMSRFTASRPAWAELSRRGLAEAFAAELPPHTILLKGSRTAIATAGQTSLFNTTGHPGMATGGMGDVLTGVCAALAGQGIPLHHCAGLGAWLCGRAAELAALDKAEESVLPTDVAAALGTAWRQLLEGCY